MIFKDRLRSWLKWPWASANETNSDNGFSARKSDHLRLARESLEALLRDGAVPGPIRATLESDFHQVQLMLDKLENERIHIGVLGRVSVGKSSLLNALLGESVFSVSPLHGETKRLKEAQWSEGDFDSYAGPGVFLLDTPGLDEIDGVQRERLAREAAHRVDLLLFVVDGDVVESEESAFKEMVATGRPVFLILNKADQLTDEQRQTLVENFRDRFGDVINPDRVIAASADPSPVTYVVRNEDGSEEEQRRDRHPDITALKEAIWDLLEHDGRTLAAINAGLFASDLSDRVAIRIRDARQNIGQRLIHTYSLAKGVAVAINPVPVADLAAALVVDASMVVHLSKVYGLPLTRSEATNLIATIVTQLVALMGTVWIIHLISSALKLGTAGLSTVATAGAQGAVGYYGTYVVGKVAENYLVRGKSWGADGPKRAIREILDSIDRDSVLAEAKDDILERLRGSS